MPQPLPPYSYGSPAANSPSSAGSLPVLNGNGAAVLNGDGTAVLTA